jgi:LPXTG-motif cell wall-anchored protein
MGTLPGTALAQGAPPNRNTPAAGDVEFTPAPRPDTTRTTDQNERTRPPVTTRTTDEDNRARQETIGTTGQVDQSADQNQPPAELPATGSPFALIGLAALGALAGAGLLRRYRR